VISLKVNGQRYEGWTSARVIRGIETVAGGFELSISERWGGQHKPWPIAEEDECTVAIDGAVVITGYVDKRSLAYSATEHTLAVSGRDKTGDLVDCSAVLSKWEFRNVDVLTLAARVASPFGVGVSSDVPTRPVAKLSVSPGDSAFDVIERACRMVGMLPVADGRGGILLTRAGTARAHTELREGVNILSARAEYDGSSRFRSYTALGQAQGTDELHGAAASVRGTAEDAEVKRATRTLLVRAEGNVTRAQARVRAQWEATVRAARADEVTIVVQGWTQGNGAVWPVNQIARVHSPTIGVDGEMLISQVVYSIDNDAGTTTQLTLRRPDAFLPEPVIGRAGSKGGAWKELAGGV
jgi:prophage tail gpP-like protein